MVQRRKRTDQPPDYHTKRQMSLRLADDSYDQLERLAGLYGFGKGVVVEMAVRKVYAEEAARGRVPKLGASVATST